MLSLNIRDTRKKRIKQTKSDRYSFKYEILFICDFFLFLLGHLNIRSDSLVLIIVVMIRNYATHGDTIDLRRKSSLSRLSNSLSSSKYYPRH
jgi:Ca2+-dependent lipid-binding protein